MELVREKLLQRNTNKRGLWHPARGEDVDREMEEPLQSDSAMELIGLLTALTQSGSGASIAPHPISRCGYRGGVGLVLLGSSSRVRRMHEAIELVVELLTSFRSPGLHCLVAYGSQDPAGDIDLSAITVNEPSQTRVQLGRLDIRVHCRNQC